MNVMRKKSALKKYSPLLENGMLLDEIKTEIGLDKLKFTDDEIATIMEEMIANKKTGTKTVKPPLKKDKAKVQPAIETAEVENKIVPGPTATPSPRMGELKTYYRHKVAAKYDQLVIRGRKEEVLVGFEKKGEVLQVTSIEPRHAEILNQQVPNSMEYYFLEGEDSLLKAENFF